MSVSMKKAVFWVVAPSYQSTLRYIPEDGHLQTPEYFAGKTDIVWPFAFCIDQLLSHFLSDS
jgi:hypothetical protein